MYRILLILFVINLPVFDLSAQVNSIFIARDYSGTGNGYSMAIDNSGNIFVCGVVINLYTVSKYSPSGDRLWKQQSTEVGRGFALYMDEESKLYTAGLYYNGNLKSVVVRKVDTSGAVLWTKVLESNININEYVKITGDNNGNSLINYSIVDSNSTTTQFIVKKFDNNGNVLYTYSKTEPGFDYSNIKSDINGNAYILYLESFVIDKVNTSGNIMWTSEFSPADSNYASDFCIDGNANIYIIGTQLNPSTQKDFATVKYNSNGIFQWSAFFNNDSALTHNLDEGKGITIGSDGFIYSVGEAHKGNNPGAYKCLRVVKYDANGNKIWNTNSFSTYSIVGARDVTTDANGNVYVTYNSRSLNGGGTYPSYLRKFDSSGNPDWLEAGYSREIMYHVMVDDENNVYTVGGSKNSLDGYLLTVRKYGQNNTGIINSSTPLKYSLSQNYPNPFNPSTSIRFDIQRPGIVRLTIYDFLGREIKTLINESLQPGSYESIFDGEGISSGVYFYRLDADGFTETRKMILLK